MICAQCGYVMTPFDTLCPRCKHVPGQSVIAPPPDLTVQMAAIPTPAPIVNTGLGICPQCGKSDIVQFDNYENHNSQWLYMGSGCFLALLGIPTIFFLGIGLLLILIGVVLFIVGMFQTSHKKIGTSRQCRTCGNRWLV